MGGELVCKTLWRQLGRFMVYILIVVCIHGKCIFSTIFAMTYIASLYDHFNYIAVQEYKSTSKRLRERRKDTKNVLDINSKRQKHISSTLSESTSAPSFRRHGHDHSCVRIKLHSPHISIKSQKWFFVSQPVPTFPLQIVWFWRFPTIFQFIEWLSHRYSPSWLSFHGVSNCFSVRFRSRWSHSQHITRYRGLIW